MRPTLYLILVSFFLAVQPTQSHSQDARQIVERAIRVHGGEAKVAMLKAMRIKVTGSGKFIPGRPEIPFTLEDVWQMPDQYKSTIRMDIDGKPFIQVQTINGNAGWIQINGQTQQLSPEALAEMKEQKYAEDLDRLLTLGSKRFKLSGLPQLQIDGRPALGIAVSSKGHRDVKLFFDKATGLLAKRVQQMIGDDGKLVEQEVYFRDYAETKGPQHWMRIEAHRNGSKVLEARVTEVVFLEKIDAREFVMP